MIMSKQRASNGNTPLSAATPEEKLTEALQRVNRDSWIGTRSQASTFSQARIAIADLQVTRLTRPPVMVQDVTEDHIRAATKHWYTQGLSPGTITKRLNCLSKMGIPVQGLRPRKVRQLKWWLSPIREAELIEWIQNTKLPDPRWLRLALYIQFITKVGLRVEEALRLNWSECHQQTWGWEITVPGMKNDNSQATLPLGERAGEILDQLWELRPVSEDTANQTVFQLDYAELNEMWLACRKFLGASESPTATLKALRRSAARYLHLEKGMPIQAVQFYLRHESVDTTMEYLRLTGGINTAEFRRWV
jgi:integrase